MVTRFSFVWTTNFCLKKFMGTLFSFVLKTKLLPVYFVLPFEPREPSTSSCLSNQGNLLDTSSLFVLQKILCDRKCFFFSGIVPLIWQSVLTQTSSSFILAVWPQSLNSACTDKPCTTHSSHLSPLFGCTLSLLVDFGASFSPQRFASQLPSVSTYFHPLFSLLAER